MVIKTEFNIPTLLPSILDQIGTSARSVQISMDADVSLLFIKYPATLKKTFLETQ